MDNRTNRQRVIDLLRENPSGLTKSKLREEIGGNAGAFRRLMQSMEDKGEIVVSLEEVPNWGPTKIHRLPETANA